MVLTTISSETSLEVRETEGTDLLDESEYRLGI